MRYELLVQAAEPGAPYDPTRVEALLAGQSTVRGDGTRLWRLKHGEVEVRPLIEGGRPIATELRVPLTGNLDFIREAVVEGVTLARNAEAALFDPQLTKRLSAGDDGLVADQYLRTARYAGEMAGVSEAIGVGQPVLEEGMKPGTKVLLGIGALFLLLYWISDRVL